MLVANDCPSQLDHIVDQHFGFSVVSLASVESRQVSQRSSALRMVQAQRLLRNLAHAGADCERLLRFALLVPLDTLLQQFAELFLGITHSQAP